MTDRPEIGVIGSGAWGTALAAAGVRAGRRVALWSRHPEQVVAINRDHENSAYLPGITLPKGLRATGALDVVASVDVVLMVTPAQSLRTVAQQMAPMLRQGTPVVLCAKGIERGTGKLMSDVLREIAPQAEPAVLSGPSFAVDVSRGLPTAVTIAARSLDLAQSLCQTLSSHNFRPYASDDLIGVQAGGALKNVFAIACGICEGRQLGASARAALTARGFAELTRMAHAMGGRTETMMGLSGLGDLVLTCSSPLSRNFSFGIAVGRDQVPPGKLAEGAHTAMVAKALARQFGIDSPIIDVVDEVLENRMTVDEAMEALLTRPLRSETETKTEISSQSSH